jgi:hypothetical protein
VIIKKFGEELIAYFPWYETSNVENDASNNSSVVACVRYRGNVSTEPLPSNDKGDTQPVFSLLSVYPPPSLTFERLNKFL